MPEGLRRVGLVLVQMVVAVALAVGSSALAVSVLGLPAGRGIVAVAAAVAGVNALTSGLLSLYDWGSVVGWLAFVLDHSWGLIGTTIAMLLNVVNLFWFGGRKYADALSRHSNRYVYDGGFGFSDFAFTQGLVTSNLQGYRDNLVDHEALHIWQSRLFGPLFQLTYISWFILGAIVGTAVSPFVKQSWYQTVVDMAYLDNPWETWAYKVGGSPRSGRYSWA